MKVESDKTYPHGTYAKYRLNYCRCEECRAANRAYERTTRLVTFKGTLVDAEPVREHLAKLMSSKRRGAHNGMGRRRIAEKAGVNEGVLSRLLYGRKEKGQPLHFPKRIKQETAEKILAVERDLSPAAVVDAGPTWSYLTEIIDFGIPKYKIAEALGNLKPGRHGGLQIGHVHVTVKTARKVERLHWILFKASDYFRFHCGHPMNDEVAEWLDKVDPKTSELRKAGLI